MNKNIVKVIGLIVILVVLVAAIVFLLIKGISIGPINAVSVNGIAEKSEDVETAKEDLRKAEGQYESNVESLALSKKEYETQKEAYELISDEKIAAVKEATKEEEYLIEYLWITLGNYATAHDLDLAIIEPGGTVGGQNAETIPTDETTVSTGTGVTGNASGVTSTTNAATTGSPTSGTQKGENEEEKETTVTVVDGLTSSAEALTVQVKGNYIDLADFVFEVENDKSLRFRLDNIKMQSAGGTDVIASFNVKDFTVLKYLER